VKNAYIATVLGVAVLLTLSSLTARASTLTVDGKMVIYFAGGNPTVGFNGGIAPAEFDFAANPGLSIVFSSVTGAVDCDGAGGFCAPFGPDGNLGNPGTIPANGFLGGISYNATLADPLLGVFLGPGLPGSAPADLDFRGAENFTSLSPLVGQVFWIGDGLTGTGSGSPQVFNVPATATRLFLGIYDGPAFDNSGQYVANFALNGEPSSVPEPASILLIPAGLAGLWMARRLRVKALNC
jgi:hypothetical protein